ncbi:hypothetical protein ACNJR3_12765 [Mycobacterium tuberculosis]
MGKGAGAVTPQMVSADRLFAACTRPHHPDTPRRMRYVTGDHAVQVFQLTSTVIDLTTKRKHTTVVYAATSMSGTPPLHR